jgi:hypothetical protein
MCGRDRATSPALQRNMIGTSGPSTLNEDQIAERGARMARRDEREYREDLREEQRSQPGCIGGRMPPYL